MQKSSLPGLLLVLVLVVAVAIWLDAPTWLLLALLLLLAGLIGGLTGSDRPSGPPPPPEEPPAAQFPPEEFYVQDQVIVRGPGGAVTAVIEALGDVLQTSRLDRLEFGQLDTAVRDCLSGCEAFDFADLVVDLYQLAGTETDVAAAIRAIEQAVGRGSDVRAEPNWLSGHPWDPTGSPWEPTGSPWDPTGSSSGGGAGAPADHFLTQWPFRQIALAEGDYSVAGRGVRIGVFDTSPFGDERTEGGAGRAIPWVTQPTPLTLALTPYPTPPLTEEQDLSSHGLFSAGLAHAVAPAAQIELIRVLNANNKGDLFTLNRALFDFILTHAPGQRPEGEIGAVINMSLGLRVPPGEAGFNLPAEVQSLRDVLRAADCAGIVVVAAAGNDSANLPQPDPAHLPANWTAVIGVAGSNQEQGRSCFSNRGELAAPAGHGRLNDAVPPQFIPANDTAVLSVIGPILQTGQHSGFAYWSGTSFAAPMVSGLAALVVEQGGGSLSPREVRQRIECGLTPVRDGALGKGIIHVPRTLDCATAVGQTAVSHKE
jgi:subtilisin family serine protease